MRGKEGQPLPLLRPSVSDLEKKYVMETLDSGWWGLGPKTKELEDRFANFVGSKYAVGVNSATAALDLALKAHDIKDGEVIVPALTFVSTGLAPIYNNNKVVFADVKEDTLCMDVEDVKKKITSQTKAIIPVHFAGKNADIKKEDFCNNILNSDCGEITIIEDCAHAAGTKGIGKNTSCWSFHAVKNIATGDGGMITTNDEEVRDRLHPLRWCGIDKSTWERTKKRYGWDYSINTVGYKMHMNDITASLGLAQLERIDDLNKARHLRVLQYQYALKDESWIKLPEYDPDMSWHLLVARVDEDERNNFIDHMLAHSISVGVHYKPLNTYPIFPETKLPVTDKVWKQLVTLPLFPDITDDEFNDVVKTIKEFK